MSVAAGVLTGCASMSESECLNADWHLIGHEDGADGKSADSLKQHRKACADFGVTPNLSEYQSGYQKGLPLFCTERNGFSKGRFGQVYNGVCPRALEHNFLNGYNHGRELYLLRVDINLMENEIDRKEKKLRRARQKSTEIKARLVADETSSSERITLLDELEDLQIKRGQLESEIHDLDIEAATLQGEFNILEARYP